MPGVVTFSRETEVYEFTNCFYRDSAKTIGERTYQAKPGDTIDFIRRDDWPDEDLTILVMSEARTRRGTEEKTCSVPTDCLFWIPEWRNAPRIPHDEDPDVEALNRFIEKLKA